MWMYRTKHNTYKFQYHSHFLGVLEFISTDKGEWWHGRIPEDSTLTDHLKNETMTFPTLDVRSCKGHITSVRFLPTTHKFCTTLCGGAVYRRASQCSSKVSRLWNLRQVETRMLALSVPFGQFVLHISCLFLKQMPSLTPVYLVFWDQTLQEVVNSRERGSKHKSPEEEVSMVHSRNTRKFSQSIFCC
jgi:hypothetical protein